MHRAPACTSILIADDHPLTAETIADVLQKSAGNHDFRRRIVHSGDELLDLLESRQDFDVLVHDLCMPGRLRRFELIKAVQALAPKLPILVLTSSLSPCVLRAAVDLGVKGFMTKRIHWSELTKAVADVAAGLYYVDPQVDLSIALHHPWFTLTASERDVALLTALGGSSRYICNKTGRAYTTVATHKTSALRKLGLSSINELISYVYDNELNFEFDELQARIPAGDGL